MRCRPNAHELPLTPKTRSNTLTLTLCNRRPPDVVCYHCGGPLEVEAIIRPGETKYKPCAACGKIGLRRVNDQWVSPHTKEPNVKPYHESPYRGGRLA
jgi:hypothetical protein